MERCKPLTEKQKKEIIERRAGICEIITCFETKNLKVHHLKRRSMGGTNDPSNLQVFCEKHHKQIHINDTQHVRTK